MVSGPSSGGVERQHVADGRAISGHAGSDSCVVLDEVVDARREGLDVGRVDGREHADAQLVAAELAVAVGVDDAVGPQRRADLGGVDRVVEVDRADDRRALGRIGDERRGPRPLLGPAVEVVRRRAAALDAPVEPAGSEHPAELGLEHDQRGDGRRVVGLVLPAVGQGDAEVERGRPPAVRGGDALDALDGGRRARRHPQSAVGGEALLRGEVVHVDLRPGPTAGRRRRTWRRRRRAPRRSAPVGAGPSPRRSRSRCG